MARIKKYTENGKTVYLATITPAVKDPNTGEGLDSILKGAPVWNLGTTVYATAQDARNAVPEEKKKPNLIITYRTAEGVVNEQFVGNVVSQWGSINSYWVRIVDEKALQPIKELIGENITNILLSEYNGFVNSTGTLVENQGFATSDYINVSELPRLFFLLNYTGGVLPISFYDSGKIFINEGRKRDKNIVGVVSDTPPKSQFFRITRHRHKKDFVIRDGNYAYFLSVLMTDIAKNSDNIEKLYDDIDELIKLSGNNQVSTIFSGDFKNNGNIDNAGNLNQVFTVFSSSDYINVSELQDLFLTITYIPGTLPISFYDSGKNFINEGNKRYKNIIGIVTDKPGNAQYFRLSIKTVAYNCVIKGGDYGYIISKLVDNIADFEGRIESFSDEIQRLTEENANNLRYSETRNGIEVYSKYRKEMRSGYINSSGVYISDRIFECTPEIPIVAGGVMYAKVGFTGGVLPLAFFDEQHKFIKSDFNFQLNGIIYEYQMPKNAAFFVTSHNATRDKDDILEYGGYYKKELSTLSKKIDSHDNNAGILKDNFSTVLILGSSLTYSAYQPHGYSWAERLNDLCDLNLINKGVSGENIQMNINWIANEDNMLYNICQQGKLNFDYILSMNSENGTPDNDKLIPYLSELNEIAKSRGAKLLIGTEEAYSERLGRMTHGDDIRDVMSSFSIMHDIPFVDTYKSSSKCYPSGASEPYKGFNCKTHGGFRVTATYQLLLPMLQSLFIRENIKCYEVRKEYMNGSYSISDLNYDDIITRAKIFKAQSCYAGDWVLNSQVDNMDSNNYEYSPSGGSNEGNSHCYTVALACEGSIPFNDIALVEFISDKIKADKATITLRCTSAPEEVYYANNSNPANSGIMTRSRFVPAAYDYSNGKIVITLQGKGIQLYDKTRILIKKTGRFSIAIKDKPSFSGISKPSRMVGYTEKIFGEELNSKTAVDTGWVLAGNAQVKSFPAQIANYPNFNDAKKHVVLVDATSTMKKTITIPKGTRRVSVKIVAQSFTKICTTRFRGVLDNEYITEQPQLMYSDYDYGTLLVNVNGRGTQKGLIWKGWHESYFEFTLRGDEGGIDINIGRDYESRYTTRANEPILIYDVSVKEIL